MQMWQVVLFESVEMLFSSAKKATDLYQQIEKGTVYTNHASNRSAVRRVEFHSPVCLFSASLLSFSLCYEF